MGDPCSGTLSACDGSPFSEPSPDWWLLLGGEDASLSEPLGSVSDGTVSVGSPGATPRWSVVVGGVVFSSSVSCLGVMKQVVARWG